MVGERRGKAIKDVVAKSNVALIVAKDGVKLA
jgi:hypothetical protein